MIYGWHANYDYIHYHFYSLFAYGSAENERFPIVSIYHLRSVLHICGTEAGLQAAGINPTVAQSPSDSIRCAECQTPIEKSCLANNASQSLPQFPSKMHKNTRVRSHVYVVNEGLPLSSRGEGLPILERTTTL